jgi:hypothetical protein
MSHLTEANVLTYASGMQATLSQRGWRMLFWAGVVHFLGLLLLIAATARGFVSLATFFRQAPLMQDWFMAGMLINNAAVPIMALANGLAIAGYWMGLHGRSPRQWFRIYAPAQLGMMAVHYAISIPLVMASPYKPTPNVVLAVSVWSLLAMPLVHLLIALPLWLLLVPKIRRGCFVGGFSGEASRSGWRSGRGTMRP